VSGRRVGGPRLAGPRLPTHDATGAQHRASDRSRVAAIHKCAGRCAGDPPAGDAAARGSVDDAGDVWRGMAGDPGTAGGGGVERGAPSSGVPPRAGPHPTPGLPDAAAGTALLRALLVPPRGVVRRAADAHRARACLRRRGALFRHPGLGLRRLPARRRPCVPWQPTRRAVRGQHGPARSARGPVARGAGRPASPRGVGAPAFRPGRCGGSARGGAARGARAVGRGVRGR
jgi:hypothetical protein